MAASTIIRYATLAHLIVTVEVIPLLLLWLLPYVWDYRQRQQTREGSKNCQVYAIIV